LVAMQPWARDFVELSRDTQAEGRQRAYFVSQAVG
jgi:hypothetical protein